jgi:hypothetical protein
MCLTKSYSIALALAATVLAGCSRFVWKEEPFTPDPAPTSEIVTSASGDTTFVLRGSSYYLLAEHRPVLWSRDVMDDVAWRYRELFGDAPPLIAVRIDSTTRRPDSATWRGVPLAAVALYPARRERSGDERRSERDPDPVAARLLARPLLAATAAETWVRARVTDPERTTDSQPGGPSRSSVPVPLPAWVEAAAIRLLASPGAAARSTAEVQGSSKAVLPLATLFAVRWPSRPNAGQITGIDREALGDDVVMGGRVEGPRQARDGRTLPGVAPIFIAQSVSVLAFMRERDPSFVGRLADALSRGRSVSDVLSTSITLPHDIAGLEAEWQKWVRRSSKRR